MNPGERLAVIDLGSNSFRLVVFMAGEGWWKRTDEIHEPVRIGEGMMAAATCSRGPSTGRSQRSTCSPTSAARAASARARSTLWRPARSATRRTPAEFLERARECPRLPIRVLSREEEARYGYLAAVNSSTLSDGCVLDLGGGSMQLVRVEGRQALESGSWRVGTVLMSERFLPPNGPAKRRQLRGTARPRRRGARDRALARRRGRGRAPAGRDRRHGAKPRGRRPARGRPSLQRRPGDGDRPRGAG